MRVNVYAEEMTDRIEIVSKVIDGVTFTGLRIYLELPVTLNTKGVETEALKNMQVRGPFIHSHRHVDGSDDMVVDDDSSAVTFWGKKDLRETLVLALEKLNAHYGCMVGQYKQQPRTMTNWMEDKCG